MRRERALAEPGHGQDTPHGVAEQDGVGGFDIGSAPCATSSAPVCDSSHARHVPATPHRSMRGVDQRSPCRTNRFADVAHTTSPSVLRIRPSSIAGSCHSSRARTCSRRLQCLSPASAGCTASRGLAPAQHEAAFARRRRQADGARGATAGGASGSGRVAAAAAAARDDQFQRHRRPASSNNARELRARSPSSGKDKRKPLRRLPPGARDAHAHQGTVPRCTRIVSNMPSP